MFSKLLRTQSVRYTSSFETMYRTRTSLEKLIQDYSHMKPPPVTLKYLLSYMPPLSKEQYERLNTQTLNYLTILTCKRLDAFRKLPYIAVLNPNVAHSYQTYLKSLQDLVTAKDIPLLLESFIDDHADTVPALSKGFTELQMEQDEVSEFLNVHLRERITMQMLASHYLALDRQTNDAELLHYVTHNSVSGLVHSQLSISQLLHQTAEFVGDLCFIKYDSIVPIKILHGEDIRFPYIPTHLEYVFQEILKNSSRAHIENGVAEKPIEVTITRHAKNLEIRIRDFGKGIKPEIEDKMFEYSYTSTEKDKKDNGMAAYVNAGEEVNNVSGMGFGLPMCKAYLEMFGGSIEVQSLYGWGTDVYLKLVGP